MTKAAVRRGASLSAVTVSRVPAADRQHAPLDGVAETLEDSRECLCPFLKGIWYDVDFFKTVLIV